MTTPARGECPPVFLSLVSHAQGHLVRSLLTDLRQMQKSCALSPGWQLGLTLNMPEEEAFLQAFQDLPLKIHRNECPLGFGANHNAAFKRWVLSTDSTFSASTIPFFGIVNPDIRLVGNSQAHRFDMLALQRLLLSQPATGACAPVVHSPQGTLEDSVRKFPTLGRLLKRVWLRVLRQPRQPDYRWNDEPITVDWAAGMFVLFKSVAFAEVGGFDERFFMYLEDADICTRLHQHGWAVQLTPACHVTHDAQRASHRSSRHLCWHTISALRYLTGI